MVLAFAGRAQAWEIFDMGSTPLPSNSVKAIAVAPNADVWVGTEYGLCRYDGSTWQVFQTGSSGLPDNDVRSLAVDDTGTVWVGTIGGLASYHMGTWIAYTSQSSPLPESYVRCLAVAPQGGLWVGTVGGLAWFDGDTTWHVYNDTPGSHNGLQLPGVNIAALAARADGLLCIGTVNAGFTYLTDTSVTVYNTFSNGLPDNTALGVGLDQNGWRWLACPAGALLHHAGDFIGGAWLQYSTLNSMIPSNSLTCIVVDGHDRRVIGNQISGLTIFQGFSTFSTYNTQNSDLPSDEVLCLALDNAGRVWVGTSNGGAARFGYAVGLDDRPVEAGARIWPNPVGDVLGVELGKGGGTGLFRLCDMMGRAVLVGRTGPGVTSVDVHGLARGCYVLDLRDATGRWSHLGRVIKD